MKSTKFATIGGYGYPWFYKTIDSAAWLWSTGKCESDEIHIEFHFFPKPLTVNFLIASLRRNSLPVLIKKYMRAKLGKNLKNIEPPASSTILIKQVSKRLVTSSIYHKVEIIEYIKAYASASFQWVNLLIRQKQPLDILSLTHRGIRVGDIAASENLRWNYEIAGKLKFSHGVFHYLFQAILHVNISLRLSGNGYSFVLCPDKFYVSGVLLKAAKQIGACVISVDNLFYEFLIEPSSGMNFDRHVDTEQSALFENYMQNRLVLGSSSLSYMEMLPSRKAFYDFSSTLIRLQNKSMSSMDVTCIIFLHQISDAQYIYGLDGYEDLVEWTNETVEVLSENSSVTDILIKFHPANNGYYKADDIFENNFVKQFSGNPKISFVSYDTTLTSLASIHNLVAITHHGSVAEELIYLNIPVIASAYSPWGGLFKFVSFQWASRLDYLSFLKNLHSDSMLSVDKMQLELLRLYVINFRLNAVEYLFRECPYKFNYYLSKQAIFLNSRYNEYSGNLFAKSLGGLEISNFVFWLMNEASRIEYSDFVIASRTRYMCQELAP